MAYTPKDGSGALFKNQRKSADNHPDYRGDLMLGGVQYEIGAWLKTSSKGDKFMSLSVKPKEQRGDAAEPAAVPERRELPSEEVPF